MALSKEVYMALEDIVGPENISEEPAILDSYAAHMGAEFVTPGQGHLMPRAEAVILPGSTEEVQAIVRVCNRYRIQYKAFSTGWIMLAGAVTGQIQIDLRRMDRILELDEKNMFAVVEPYAIARTVQAEAMKVGLNLHEIGAGAGTSPLAQCTSFLGHGADGIFMGHATEVLLALEWVMPNGELMRTGSLGSGSGWFCGEGPGPSIRAVVRGTLGTMGGMGIYTKCAIKLSPWPGPSELPLEDPITARHLSLPENFKAYTIAAPSWQAWADLVFKIWDSEIAYMIHRQYNQFGADLSIALFKVIFPDSSKTLEDLEEAMKDPEIQRLTEEARISFQILLAGFYPGDIEYKEKYLEQILAETGCHKVAALAEPDIMKFTLFYFITGATKQGYAAFGGGHPPILAHVTNPDGMIRQVPLQVEAMRPFQEKGLLVKCGDDTVMGGLAAMGDGGGYSYLEQVAYYDPLDKESVNATLKLFLETDRVLKEHGWTLGEPNLLDLAFKSKEEIEAIRRSGPQPIIYNWQWKIKQMLDPNNISAGGYHTVEPQPKQKEPK